MSLPRLALSLRAPVDRRYAYLNRLLSPWTPNAIVCPWDFHSGKCDPSFSKGEEAKHMRKWWAESPESTLQQKTRREKPGDIPIPTPTIQPQKRESREERRAVGFTETKTTRC